MKCQIKCLDVKDGDAIIVNLVNSSSNLVFLIDGGHNYDSDKIIENLEKILQANNKQAPDFILCTHYDDDHIGGLFGVVNYYGNKIGKVWIHKTSERINIQKAERTETIFPTESDDILNYGGISIDNGNPIHQELIKNLQQEMDFLSLLVKYNIDVEEPFVENFTIKNWPELRLLGPSLDFYQKLFPEHFTVVDCVNYEFSSPEIDFSEDLLNDVSSQLDSIKRYRLTPTNLNSAILLLQINDKKILFTGDAGIQSFESIIDSDGVLEGLHLLKVPHHASHHNINSTLIKLFRPKISLISGNRHVSELVIRCLESVNSEIYSTKVLNNDITLSIE